MVVMAGLYFLAGLVGRLCGGFDLARLGGLYRRAPLLAAAAFVLLMSVSGLPPFSGFWPKAMLVRAALDQGAWWLAAALLVSGFLITFAAGRVFLLAFWRPEAEAGGETAVPALPLAVVAALAALSLVVGVWPEPVAWLAAAAAQGLAEPSAYIHSVFPEPRP
jgi:multicomponent Na+:H+ antiporter subunit D